MIEFALWSMAVSPFVSAPSFSLNWDNVSEAIKRECWQTSNLLSRDNEAQALLCWRNMFDIYSPFEEYTNLPQSLQPLQNMITALFFLTSKETFQEMKWTHSFPPASVMIALLLHCLTCTTTVTVKTPLLCVRLIKRPCYSEALSRCQNMRP